MTEKFVVSRNSKTRHAFFPTQCSSTYTPLLGVHDCNQKYRTRTIFTPSSTLVILQQHNATTTSIPYSESQMPAENYKTRAIISVNAIYCRFPFIYTIQGLDLFLDLLGDLSFSESVVESSVDIFQVSASASTWGSSSLGLGGPVELGNQFSFSILS